MILDNEFLKIVTPAIYQRWNSIANDIYACMVESGDDEGDLDNAAALEACLDADGLHFEGCQEAYELVKTAFAEHKYEVVMKFLEKQIQLV